MNGKHESPNGARFGSRFDRQDRPQLISGIASTTSIGRRLYFQFHPARQPKRDAGQCSPARHRTTAVFFARSWKALSFFNFGLLDSMAFFVTG